ERLVAARPERRDEPTPDVLDVECGLYRAVGQDPLGHLEACGARHDRLRLLVLKIIDALTTVTLQGEDVAKALGGDERRREPLALEHGVGGNRWALRGSLDPGDRDAVGDERFKSAFAGRRRPASPLLYVNPVGPDGDQVRKRPPAPDAAPHKNCVPREPNPPPP